MLTDGIAIMQKYLPFFYGMVIGCIIIGFVLLLLFDPFTRGPKYQQKIRYRYVVPLIIVGVVAFGGITQLDWAREYYPIILETLHLLMRIMDILTVLQLRFSIQESVSQRLFRKRD